MKKDMNLSNIMKQMWMFVKMYGMSKSDALRQAWKNYQLKIAMKTRIVKFFFQKVDGSTRVAWGTLIAKMLPPTSGQERKSNPTTQVYFDCEKQAYRCFKIANLIRFEAA